MTADVDQRIEAERAFMNEAVTGHALHVAAPFYSIFDSSKHAYLAAITRDGVAGKRILEIGCGANAHPIHLAKAGAHIDGIDISDVALEHAARRAAEEGVADRVTLHCMNAERTDFPESTFDIVCASAVLHHLDLAAALPEIRRILKPGGRGCFLEPLGHNPAINLYRRLTPHLRSPNEHPLVAADLRRIRELFPRVQTTFFCLASFAAIPLRRTPLFAPVLSALEKLDRILLATQTLGKYSWVVLVEAYRG